MKIEKVNIDFHRNGWVVQKPLKNRLSRIIVDRFLENHPKNLAYIVDNLFSQDENRAIFLLNYVHDKYKDVVTNGLVDMERRGYQVNLDHMDSFVGITGNEGKT
jgi:hypothetical protein